MHEPTPWESESAPSRRSTAEGDFASTAAGDQNTGRSAGELGEDSLLSHRLKLYFASLSCLGGVVLGSGTGMEVLAVTAVFFALFGFVCVDWLKLFALPSIAAYTAMGLAAIYCVSNFIEFDAPNTRQMRVVAELLVFVQAILMLQEKTHRIYEQLGVFCLLQLIVAAVFNNAVNYGLLLVPVAVVGAWALSLLVVLRSSESISASAKESAPSIRCSAGQAKASLESATRRLPWVVLLTVGPAVLLVAAIFFYALPRTTDASQMGKAGKALVGFSDQVRLEQIGKMIQSDRLALRVQLKDNSHQKLYKVAGPLYLRGKVLDRYRPSVRDGLPSAVWVSVPPSDINEYQTLPPEYYPSRMSDKNFYDSIDVRVSSEPMRTPSLFAIAPFHGTQHQQEIMQATDRWTLSRQERMMPTLGWDFPRVTYRFGTHAFRDGVQSEFIARWSKVASWRKADDPSVSPQARQKMRETRLMIEDYNRQYRQILTAYDSDAVPTAARLATTVAESGSPGKRGPYWLARRLETLLRSDSRFGYTLNLDAEPMPGVDPIEQFLAHDQKGNCQYFASALVMMLRSQEIPARLVVGYKTEEYNEIGGYYVARQRHAHAWVEALIDKDDLPQNALVYGQVPSEQYWLRLDPTPGGGGTGQTAGGGVEQVFDLAQNIWEDYVVDMDGSRQKDALLDTGGMSPMSESYARLINSIKLLISRIQAGELGGGSLASGQLFSWPAAMFGVGMTLLVFVLVRIRLPAWIRRKIDTDRPGGAAQPSLPFFAETLEQLGRLGLWRQAAETPAEFTSAASRQIARQRRLSVAEPLALLTDAFYRLRFGPADRRGDDAAVDSLTREALGELKQRIDQIDHQEPRREAADVVSLDGLSHTDTSA